MQGAGKKMKNKNIFIVFVVVDFIVFAIVAAVIIMKAKQPGQKPSSKIAATQTQTATPAKAKKQARVYFYDKSMSRLVAQAILVENAGLTTDARVRLSAEKLLSGPSKHSPLVSTFPEDVKVKEIKVQGDTVTVDFNKNFLKPYGATMEIGMVGSLVLTLTDIPGIKKVQILCEGKKVPYLPEGMEIGNTLTRGDVMNTEGNNSKK